jgi:hypothetical protein
MVLTETEQLDVLIFQLLKAEQRPLRTMRTSKLLASLAIKKQGGALIIYRALRGWGGGQHLLKNLRASPFNKDLSHETTFNPIHLAGQYL